MRRKPISPHRYLSKCKAPIQDWRKFPILFSHTVTFQLMNHGTHPSTERPSTHAPLFPNLNSSQSTLDCRPLPCTFSFHRNCHRDASKRTPNHAYLQQTIHIPHSFTHHSRPRSASSPAQSTEHGTRFARAHGSVHCVSQQTSLIVQFNE